MAVTDSTDQSYLHLRARNQAHRRLSVVPSRVLRENCFGKACSLAMHILSGSLVVWLLWLHMSLCIKCNFHPGPTNWNNNLLTIPDMASGWCCRR